MYAHVTDHCPVPTKKNKKSKKKTATKYNKKKKNKSIKTIANESTFYSTLCNVIKLSFVRYFRNESLSNLKNIFCFPVTLL